jgi:AcrR family transcriptional regulator
VHGIPNIVGEFGRHAMTMEARAASDLISSPRERRERMRQEMVTAILEAALGVMRERGVAGLSLREVARQVKLQASSLYEYFPSKAALYDALFLMGIRRYGAYKERVAAQEFDSFWDYVAGWLTTYMEFAQEHPELYQLVFERPVPGFVPSEESMVESRSMLGAFEHMLQRAVDQGCIRPSVSMVHARDLLIAMMHGLTSQHVANEPRLAAGSGRYGSLIPDAVDLFRAAWEPTPVAGEDMGGTDGDTDQG